MACFKTSAIALSISATLDPWWTFKQAFVKEERIKMGSRMLHRIIYLTKKETQHHFMDRPIQFKIIHILQESEIYHSLLGY